MQKGDILFLADYTEKPHYLEVQKVGDKREIDTPDGRYFVELRPYPGAKNLKK